MKGGSMNAIDELVDADDPVSGITSVAARRVPQTLAPSLELRDGAVASLVDGGLELRDRGGRLLVRYCDGNAEIAAPSGDLVLSSPTGRVVVRSALDVQVEAGRDLVQRAGRTVELSAGAIALTAQKYELAATRIFEKSRDTFRSVADLCDTRVGRARTLVSTLFTLKAQRTVMASKEETSIDGRKILLG